jgi:AraC-like DNA-binding protein
LKLLPLRNAQRAAKLLRDRAAIAPRITDVAREIGVSRAVMIRQFRQAYGMPPVEYLTRLRLRLGMKALRDRLVKVREAGRQAGYQSVKNFNGALRIRVGLTPSQVRHLSDDEYQAVVSRQLDLPHVRSEASRSRPAVVFGPHSCLPPTLRGMRLKVGA